MKCPFPGMDPYLEWPVIWPDFHSRLVTGISVALQPVLRPRYVALGQERLFVVESDRPIVPDVSIIKRREPAANNEARSGSSAVMELDTPAVFQLSREMMRQPYITIIEPVSGRVVSAIDVLSPDNKRAGEGRDSYLRKRDELWAARANLIEIDLIRDGDPTVRVSPEHLEEIRPWHYLVSVTRCEPPRQEVYAVPLSRRLPRIAVPLAAGDRDVALNLQAVFTRCWDEGPYPEVLRYDQAPPGSMSETDQRWCAEQLKSSNADLK